jgi:hypothetical protein
MIIEGFEIPDCISFDMDYNLHKQFYKTIESYFNEQLVCMDVSQKIIDECVKYDCVWEIRVYKFTPIGFLYGVGPTLKDALIMIFEGLTDEKDRISYR